jgi:signal transduction histidine kinase/predicted negative regulator of RcsB-dependent stress response
MNITIRLLVSSFLLFSSLYRVQADNIDSLLIELNNATNNNTKNNILRSLTKEMLHDNNDEALKYINQHIELSKKLNDEKQLSYSYISLASYYYNHNTYDSAQKYLEYIKNSPFVINNDSVMSNYLLLKGNTFYMQERFDSALYSYEKCLNISNKINDNNLSVRCLANIGLIYTNNLDYSTALEYYNKASDIISKSNIEDLPTVLNKIGVLYIHLEEYDKALEILNRTLAINKDKRFSSLIINNIGTAYINKGDYQTALKYLRKALAINIEINNTIYLPSSFLNIGSIYFRINKLDSCEYYYKKSLFYQKEINNKYELSKIYFNLGKLYTEKQEIDSALNYLIISKNIADSINYLEIISANNEAISKIYKRKKQYKKALEYYTDFKILDDSIHKIMNIKKISLIENKYKHEKDILDLKRGFNKEKTKSKSEINIQKTQKYILLVLLILSIIALIFIFKMLNLIKQKNISLHEKNKKIHEQAEKLKENKLILEEKVLERTKELLKAKEDAENSDRLKTRFLNNISHEFRTPINGIIGFSELLISNENSDDDKKHFHDIIAKNCNQLLNVVTDTIEISNIHNKSSVLNKTNFNINKLIGISVEKHRHLLLNKDIEINTEIKIEPLYENTFDDKEKIERIFRHLITNAIRFTKEGSIKIIGEFSNNNYQFRIIDTGCGIPSNIINTVFDTFSQYQPDSTQVIEGNGIGLSICKAYIEMLGGEITISSELKKGTTVSFSIPRKTGNSSSNKEYTNKENIEILVAEDDEINALLIKHILKDANANLLFAKNGKEAVEIYKNHKNISIVIMDIKMPIMNGLEAGKIIKQIKPEQLIIAHSAFSSDTEKNEIMKNGFDYFLEKPINKTKLYEIIMGIK